MSGNRTNSYETPQTDVTDYQVLCISMRFMSSHSHGQCRAFIPNIYGQASNHRRYSPLPIIAYGQIVPPSISGIIDASLQHSFAYHFVCY